MFAGLLKQWQRTINLVAPSTVDDVWHRHIADSAQLLGLAPAGPLQWVDLGSGGGFPGIVIAILLAERPGSKISLIESDARKGAFLREVVRQTGIGGAVTVDIIIDRIESVANTTRVGNVEVISARALAPLGRLLGWCLPFWGAETMALLPKGRDMAQELADAQSLWAFSSSLVPSLTSDDAKIVVVRDLRRR